MILGCCHFQLWVSDTCALGHDLGFPLYFFVGAKLMLKTPPVITFPSNIVWSLFSLKDRVKVHGRWSGRTWSDLVLNRRVRGCQVVFCWHVVRGLRSRGESLWNILHLFGFSRNSCWLIARFYVPLSEQSGWQELHSPGVFELGFSIHCGLFCPKSQ